MQLKQKHAQPERSMTFNSTYHYNEMQLFLTCFYTQRLKKNSCGQTTDGTCIYTEREKEREIIRIFL